MPRATIRATTGVLAAAVLAAMASLGTTGGAQARQLPGFADLVAETAPAVVSIAVTATKTASRNGFEDIPEYFRNFPEIFRNFPFGQYQDQNSEGEEEEVEVRIVGSGFVIDPAGYIVTNHHVIEDADRVEIQFSPELRLEAAIVGADRRTDIALLKVQAGSPLPFIRFGDSEQIRVGDWVLAIGNPFGVGESVSAGIVSARNGNREITEGLIDDYIQTDAAVNRGNSGGPLLNGDGDVIGVITAIISPSGASSGVALAVPSRISEHVVQDLREFGQVRRGYLGVHFAGVDEDLAESLGMEEPMGAIVEEVVPDSPAAEAGLKAGDVILEYDGREIVDYRDLPLVVADTDVGRQVRVKIWREERTMMLTTRVGLREDEPESGAPEGEEEPTVTPGNAEALGMTVVSLDAEGREAYGIGDDVSGALVTEVTPRSPAARAEIEPGQVIEEINYAPVRSAEDVLRLIREAQEGDRDKVPVRLRDPSGNHFVGLSIRE